MLFTKFNKMKLYLKPVQRPLPESLLIVTTVGDLVDKEIKRVLKN